MAILRYKEIKKLSDKELSSKKLELEKERIRLNSQVASGSTPENPGNIREIKRALARIETFENITGGTKQKI